MMLLTLGLPPHHQIDEQLARHPACGPGKPLSID